MLLHKIKFNLHVTRILEIGLNNQVEKEIENLKKKLKGVNTCSFSDFKGCLNP